MEFIDEDGRIFGTINVVDALVVLFVLAVGLAGIVLVTGANPQESIETRYVTLDLGTQPEFVIDQIETGDVDRLSGEPGNITITDTYRTTAVNGTNAVVRAAVTKPQSASSFTVGGEPLRVGQNIEFENESYVVETTIRDIGTRPTLPTEQRSVVLRGTVPTDVANDVTADMDILVSGNTIATVEDVAAYEANSPDRRTLFLETDLRTYVSGDTARFGETRLEPGRSLSLPVAGYQFSGTIDSVDSAINQTSRKVLVTSTVSAETAEEIETGDAYRIAGREIANIEDFTVYDTDNPDRKRVFAGLSVRTLGYSEDPRFGTQSIQEGAKLPFRTGDYDFEANVLRTETADPQLATKNIVVTDIVDADTARDMREGDTYQVSDHTVATIENLTAYGTSNPERTRIYAGLSIQTLEFGERPQFGTQTVRDGATLPFRTPDYDFNGNIVERRSSDLQLRTEQILVTDIVDVDVARGMTEGDAYRVAGEATATIEKVAVYGTNDPDRKRVYVGLSVRTLGYGEVPRFGANTQLREGATIPFRTPDYQLSGEIVRLGTFVEPGQSTTRIVTLQMENVSPERANSVRAGLTETNADQTIARVTDVDVQPAIVTLTSESGDIYEREHPVNKDVTLTVELSVRERDSSVRFKGRTLQEGNQVTLDLGTTTITATVIDLDADDE